MNNSENLTLKSAMTTLNQNTQTRTNTQQQA